MKKLIILVCLFICTGISANAQVTSDLTSHDFINLRCIENPEEVFLSTQSDPNDETCNVTLSAYVPIGDKNYIIELNFLEMPMIIWQQKEKHPAWKYVTEGNVIAIQAMKNSIAKKLSIPVDYDLNASHKELLKTFEETHMKLFEYSIFYNIQEKTTAEYIENRERRDVRYIPGELTLHAEKFGEDAYKCRFESFDHILLGSYLLTLSDVLVPVSIIKNRDGQQYKDLVHYASNRLLVGLAELRERNGVENDKENLKKIKKMASIGYNKVVRYGVIIPENSYSYKEVDLLELTKSIFEDDSVETIGIGFE